MQFQKTRTPPYVQSLDGCKHMATLLRSLFLQCPVSEKGFAKKDLSVVVIRLYFALAVTKNRQTKNCTTIILNGRRSRQASPFLFFRAFRPIDISR